jgi:trigger factor
MQITETSAEGLKHEFTVVIASNDIEQKMLDRLAEIAKTVRLPGFRPGKVPMPLLRKRYGASVLGEVLESTVSDSSAQAIADKGLRPAMQPKIEIVSFKEGTDLEYKLAVEVMPEIKPIDFAEIELERLRPEVPEEAVDTALERVAEPHRKGEKVDRPAANGDVVVMDFVGSVDGKEFPGGSATDHRLELGSGRFIPGFEDQLVGIGAGDERTVAVTFPADYGNDELAGKAASFTVKAKAIEAMQPATIDDEFAKELGFEDLAGLRKGVRDQLERDYNGLARRRLKRKLLDDLAARHDFPVPPGMAELEFDTIWKQFEQAREHNKEAVAEEAGKSDDELKVEYRGIAERRVRLGLLLAEIGQSNSLTVSPEEVNRALFEEARKHQGYEKQVIEFYRGNPQAMANLRAPIFEDKVVDFILEMAKVTDRPVAIAELLADDEAAADDDKPAERKADQ